MAQEQGLSKSTVGNPWRSHNLKPHRVKRCKLSRDPKFLEKLTDVVGLYRNPPQPALVLCVEEKSQIQALNRTQPGLPLKQGRCGTLPHDYQRPGTPTLFAALELAQGKVVGQCQQRPRNQEFLKFLRTLDQEFSGKVPLHWVGDNYGTHKPPRVRAGLRPHPRFVLHFVPTRCSWLNLIERWCGELTAKRVRRGSFCSGEERRRALLEFLEAWNQAPQPLVWTATVDSLTAKLARCRQTLEQIQPGCTLPRTRKKKS
jgi:transposase